MVTAHNNYNDNTTRRPPTVLYCICNQSQSPQLPLHVIHVLNLCGLQLIHSSAHTHHHLWLQENT